MREFTLGHLDERRSAPLASNL